MLGREGEVKLEEDKWDGAVKREDEAAKHISRHNWRIKEVVNI